MRRIARRAGVKRMSKLAHEAADEIFREFAEKVLKTAHTLNEHSQCKRVSVEDILYL